MTTHTRFVRGTSILATAAVLALSLAAARAGAATIAVPPITVTSLTHQVYFPTSGTPMLRDSIVIPGGGYTSAPFTATLSAGDVVVVRIQAPAGQAFALHDLDGSGETLAFDVLWYGPSDVASSASAATVTFENLSGAVPVASYVYGTTSDCGYSIWTHCDFAVPGDARFTAIRIEIPVSHPSCQANVAFTLGSDMYPSFVGEQHWIGSDGIVMDLVDLVPTPARASTWGRLKAHYR